MSSDLTFDAERLSERLGGPPRVAITIRRNGMLLDVIAMDPEEGAQVVVKFVKLCVDALEDRIPKP